MSSDIPTLVERLRQLNSYMNDGSHWVARIEVGPGGAPLVSFWRELAPARVPDFLRSPGLEIKG